MVYFSIFNKWLADLVQQISYFISHSHGESHKIRGEKKQRDTKNNKQTAHLDRVIGVNQPFIFGHGFSLGPKFSCRHGAAQKKKNTKKKNLRWPRLTFFSHFLDILETLEVLVARSLIMSWPNVNGFQPTGRSSGETRVSWWDLGPPKQPPGGESANMFRSGFQRAEKFSDLEDLTAGTYPPGN